MSKLQKVKKELTSGTNRHITNYSSLHKRYAYMFLLNIQVPLLQFKSLNSLSKMIILIINVKNQRKQCINKNNV